MRCIINKIGTFYSPQSHISSFVCVVEVVMAIAKIYWQTLPYKDVRFWRIKTLPGLKELKKYNGRRPITQVFKRSEKNQDIYNDLKLKKKTLISTVYTKIFQGYKG